MYFLAMPAPRATIFALASVVTVCTRELDAVRIDRMPIVKKGEISLESSAKEGLRIVGGTCYSQTQSGTQSTLGAPHACELLYLPAAQLIYVRVGSEHGQEDHLIDAIKNDVWRAEYRSPPNYTEIALKWTERFLSNPRYSGQILLFHPPGDHLEADKQVRSIVDSVAASTRPVEHPTVQVDFAATCHSEANWPDGGPHGEPARSDSIQVYWLANAHHVNVVAAHRDEKMGKEDLLKSEAAAENLEGEELDSIFERPLPQSFVSDSPPPSCYIDPDSSPDCAHYEPHVSELRSFLLCLGVPTTTLVEQKLAADLLRQLLFHLRAPIAPRELAVVAATSMWRSFTRYAAELPGRSNMPFFMEAWPMPGHAASCLGLKSSLEKAGPRVAAIACYLPMSSVTGFGMTYQGTTDETSYHRKESLWKGAFQVTGWREPDQEETENTEGLHGKLISRDGSTVQSPGKAIARIDAPSMCARVIFDRLRRLSFMQYNNKAWFGREHDPVNSLRPASIQECIEAKRSTGNCRYYVGCVLRLLADFDKIPGVSRRVVEHCAAPSRSLVQIDSQWMKTDNRYWMRLGTWDVSRPFNFLQSLNFASHHIEPPGIAGFLVGDVVRIHKPGYGVHNYMYIVESLGQGATEGRVCLRRGKQELPDSWIHCFHPANLRHVPANGWRLQEGTGVPIET